MALKEPEPKKYTRGKEKKNKSTEGIRPGPDYSTQHQR